MREKGGNSSFAQDGAPLKAPPRKDMNGGAPIKTPPVPKPTSSPKK